VADAGVLELQEGTEPGSPSATYYKIFVDDSDGLLKKKDSSGNVVTLSAPNDTDEVPEGATNLYFTNTRARTAVVDDAITNGVLDKAPSQNAVFDALTLKLGTSATTSDVAEGSNLYFTDTRAKTAVVDDAITNGVTDKAPSQNAVFDALAAKSGSILNTNILFVDKSGNDGTGTGSQEKPFLTVAAAMAAVSSPTSANRYAIFVGVGTFTEATLTLKPWTWIVGVAGSTMGGAARISVTGGSITLDASWADGSQRGGLTNIYLTGSTAINFDRQAISGSGSVTYEFANVGMNGGITVKAAQGTLDFVDLRDVRVFGAVACSGGAINIFNCELYSTVTFDNSGLQDLESDIIGSYIVGAASFTSSGANTVSVNMRSSVIDGTITPSGSGTTVNSRLSYYKPTTSGDWSSVPTTVEAALDTLAGDLDAKLTDPMTTNGDLITQASGVPSRIPIGTEDSILRVVGGEATWEEENLMQDIGDGSDGNLTLSGALTAGDILYYDTLTLDTVAALNPDAYIIYAKTLDLSNAPAGAIFRNGNAGTNSANNTGGAGGTAFTARVLATNAAGGAGATGQTNNGTQGGAGGAVTIGNGGSGGASGASGAGGTGAAAAAIAGGAVTTNIHFGRFEYQFIRGVTQVSGGAGGRGGNSGGGNGASSSRGGGGGGAGGAVLVLYCGEIITSGSTPAGVITAKGGQGGRQTNAPAAGDVGGAGGGGGGGGGYIYIAYVKKTGPVVANLIDASGGNGGDGSNGLGTGIGGNGGQGGTGGKIQLFNVTTGVGTLTVGSAGSNGTVGSGVTGGVGGQGGSCKVSL